MTNLSKIKHLIFDFKRERERERERESALALRSQFSPAVFSEQVMELRYQVWASVPPTAELTHQP